MIFQRGDSYLFDEYIGDFFEHDGSAYVQNVDMEVVFNVETFEISESFEFEGEQIFALKLVSSRGVEIIDD